MKDFGENEWSFLRNRSSVSTDLRQFSSSIRKVQLADGQTSYHLLIQQQSDPAPEAGQWSMEALIKVYWARGRAANFLKHFLPAADRVVFVGRWKVDCLANWTNCEASTYAHSLDTLSTALTRLVGEWLLDFKSSKKSLVFFQIFRISFGFF